jgi:hypothetical protein
MIRWRYVAGAVVGGLAAAGAAAVLIWGSLWQRDTERAVARLLDSPRRTTDPGERVFDASQLEGLPAPVARYLAFALPEGQPRIRTAAVRWTGEFQMRPGGGWSPFTATQEFTADPPGFACCR